MATTKYSDMKDSGAAWLGSIPSSWPQQHLRYVFQPSKQVVGEATGDYKLLSLTLRGVIPRSDVSGGKNPENYDTYQVAEPNDLLMCLFDYDVTPRTVGEVTQKGMVTGAYTILKPNTNISSRFYYYFFLALDETKELLHLCTGLRNGLSKPVFFGLNIPVPPYETQQKVAEFLDTETAKIDNLIAKQEKLLQFLEEKRRATITHTITRGLDLNVRLKETNIPWLGKIPAHWTLGKIKNTVDSQRNGIWGDEADGGDDDIVCIRVADFDRKKLRVTENKFTMRSIPKKDQDGRLLKMGDLLFEKSGGGDKQLVGQIVKYDLDLRSVTSNFVSKLTIAAGHSADFLVYMHASLYYQRVNYRSIKQTSGIQNIDSQAYFNEFVGIPPIREQEEIADIIGTGEMKIALLSKKIQTQIALLKERRTSLISHAVTGKVKV